MITKEYFTLKQLQHNQTLQTQHNQTLQTFCVEFYNNDKVLLKDWLLHHLCSNF